MTKCFGALVANDRVNLSVFAGEVHAVLGENGAGKSTLMKMLYGFYHPTSGEIWLDGRPTIIHSPLDGRRLGVGMVFQNFSLIPSLQVLENIALFIPDQPFVLNRAALAAKVSQVADRYHLHVNLHAYVGELALGEQQKVEILKILLSGARVLIFDEPTSVLAPHEVEGLFRVFSQLKADGYAVLFITHKLPEVMASADRITVLRRGAVVGSMLAANATQQAIVRLMLGSEDAPFLELGIAEPERHEDHRPAGVAPVLEFHDLTLVDSTGGVGLDGVSFTIYPGEIVGVAGVSGNGQDKLGDVVLRIQRETSGDLHIAGQDAGQWTTAQVLAAGVACIPEAPLGMAAIPGMTVLENMIFGSQDQYARQGGFSMAWGAARADAERLLNTTFISSPPSLTVNVENLSGGNLQRVIIAREIGRQPKLLIAYYIVRGLDISNAHAAHDLLRDYRDRGAGILLVSEDLDELFALSDRLLVMVHGRIAGIFRPDATSPEQVGKLMTGGEASWP